jgi:hypothetical protein
VFETLLPRRIDNEYRGIKAALWIVGLVLAVKAAQSLAIIFAGYATGRDADGIPLDTYSPASASTVVAALAQGSLWGFFFCLVCTVVLVRYRGAVPLMFALLAVNYIAARVLLVFVPFARIGGSPGPVVNFVLFALMLVGFGLSLWRRGAQDTNS